MVNDIILKKNLSPDLIFQKLVEEANSLPSSRCDCECHEFGLMHHNPCLSILSNLQCFECSCEPIPFDAGKITVLGIQLKSIWKKKNGYPSNSVCFDYPEWLKDETIFMRLLIQVLSKK